MTDKTITASGEPRVVIWSTKGFRVQRRCVGQNGAGPSPALGVAPIGDRRRIRGTVRDMRTRTSLPRRGWMTVDVSSRGNSGE